MVLVLTGALSSSPAVASAASCVLTLQGDLQAEVQARIDDEFLPGPGSNGMVLPTREKMAAWEVLIDLLARGEAQAACTVLQANNLPYQLVYYTDSGTGLAYWLLREETPISAGWGTFVIRAGAALRDAIIEVPHPGFEIHCAEEAVGLLRALDLRALLLAGTDRCSNTGYSPCQGTTAVCGQEEPFRESDAGHATLTMFQAAHRVLVPHGAGTIAIQLHGHGQLACPDVFVSNGTCTPGPLTMQLAGELAAACPSFAVDVADCGANECSLVGGTNVQGRFSNGCRGSPDCDPCLSCAAPPAPPVPEQFIHIEQSHAFRDDYACLVPALVATLSSHVSRRAVPEAPRDLLRSLAAPRMPAGTPTAYPQTARPGRSLVVACTWHPVLRNVIAR